MLPQENSARRQNSRGVRPVPSALQCTWAGPRPRLHHRSLLMAHLRVSSWQVSYWNWRWAVAEGLWALDGPNGCEVKVWQSWKTVEEREGALASAMAEPEPCWRQRRRVDERCGGWGFWGNGRPHSPRIDGGTEGGAGSSWKGSSLTSPGHSWCQGSRDRGRWTDTSAH